MHLPAINHGVGVGVVRNQGWGSCPSWLGPSEGHTAWLSTSILVPRPWSMASPSFSSGIWFEKWSEGWRKGCRNCRVRVQDAGASSSFLGL